MYESVDGYPRGLFENISKRDDNAYEVINEVTKQMLAILFRYVHAYTHAIYTCIKLSVEMILQLLSHDGVDKDLELHDNDYKDDKSEEWI